jgi:hypothetical protein
MDCNSFKDILCSFLKEDKLIKPKTKAGALEIMNIKWKTEAGATAPAKIKIQTKLTNEIVQ